MEQTIDERIKQYEDMTNHWIDVAKELNKQLKQWDKTVAELQSVLEWYANENIYTGETIVNLKTKQTEFHPALASGDRGQRAKGVLKCLISP